MNCADKEILRIIKENSTSSFTEEEVNKIITDIFNDKGLREIIERLLSFEEE